MSRDDAKLAAMQNFVLASGTNLQTAILIHDAMDGVRNRLVSELVKQVSETLKEREPSWQVIDNSLEIRPFKKWECLVWGPPQWREYQWGVGLSAEKENANDMLFGFSAPSKGTERQPAMPDEDRQALAAALNPVLSALGRTKESPQWPCYIWLPDEIRRWEQHTALTKIAHALGYIEELDLVVGKKLDDYLVDAFLAAKQAIAPIVEKKEIKPVPK